MEYIRKTYGVPAKRKTRVIANGNPGVITGSRGACLKIRLNGETKSRAYHPTWEIQYIDNLN